MSEDSVNEVNCKDIIDKCITVWKDGCWKIWERGDGYYAQSDKTFLLNINVLAPEKPNLVEGITFTQEQVKGILASMALSDHWGDALEAIEPLAKAVGLKVHEVNMETLRERGLLPEYLKD